MNLPNAAFTVLHPTKAECGLCDQLLPCEVMDRELHRMVCPFCVKFVLSADLVLNRVQGLRRPTAGYLTEQ